MYIIIIKLKWKEYDVAHENTYTFVMRFHVVGVMEITKWWLMMTTNFIGFF